MSKSKLDWLISVSNEDAENVSAKITPEENVTHDTEEQDTDGVKAKVTDTQTVDSNKSNNDSTDDVLADVNADDIKVNATGTQTVDSNKSNNASTDDIVDVGDFEKAIKAKVSNESDNTDAEDISATLGDVKHSFETPDTQTTESDESANGESEGVTGSTDETGVSDVSTEDNDTATSDCSANLRTFPEDASLNEENNIGKKSEELEVTADPTKDVSVESNDASVTIDEGTPLEVEGVDTNEISIEELELAIDEPQGMAPTIAEHMGEVADDLEEINKVGIALEAYASILSEAIEDGGVVDKRLAQAIQIGLESFGDSYIAQTMPSLENFDKPTGALVYSSEALDSVKSRLKDVGRAAVAAIRKLLQWLKELWNKFRKATPDNTTRIQELEQALSQVKSENHDSLKISGAARLCINGEFHGAQPQPIADLAMVGSFINNDYLREMGNLVKVFTETYDDRLDSNISSGPVTAGWSALETAIKKINLKGFPTVEVKENLRPEEFSQCGDVRRSLTLVGNKALFIGTQGDNVRSATIATTIHRFRVDLVSVPGAEPLSEVEIKAPPVSVIRQMIANLKNLNKVLADSLKTDLVISKHINDLIDNAEKAYADEKFNGNGNHVVTFARTLAMPSANYFEYVARLISLYVLIIHRYIKHHQAAAQ